MELCFGVTVSLVRSLAAGRCGVLHTPYGLGGIGGTGERRGVLHTPYGWRWQPGWSAAVVARQMFWIRPWFHGPARRRLVWGDADAA